MSLLSRLQTPVFHAEGIPKINVDSYRLNVWGLMEGERQFSLSQIKEMPFTRLNARLTSVSGWSVRADWDGILWRDFTDSLVLLPQADYVTFTSVGGYDTTVPMTELNDRVLLVYAVGGETLEREYGGPLRMLIPHLWGYKSCKWLGSIEFHSELRGGFWEDRGYSRSGAIEAGLTLDINTRIERPIAGGCEVTGF